MPWNGACRRIPVIFSGILECMNTLSEVSCHRYSNLSQVSCRRLECMNTCDKFGEYKGNKKSDTNNDETDEGANGRGGGGSGNRKGFKESTLLRTIYERKQNIFSS